MDQKTEGAPKSIDIPKPNVKDPAELDKWFSQYLTEPFKGYEDLRHPTENRPLTKPEMIDVTKQQILKGMPEDLTDEQKADFIWQMVVPEDLL